MAKETQINSRILILPIGLIVYLKEDSKKLMIINRGSLLESNQRKALYDYCA